MTSKRPTLIFQVGYLVLKRCNSESVFLVIWDLNHIDRELSRSLLCNITKTKGHDDVGCVEGGLWFSPKR